jgi:hypothetical protein
MSLSEALEKLAQDAAARTSDRRAAIRLLALVPTEERVNAVGIANRLGQDSTLSDSLLAEAGRARARLDIAMGRYLATDDVELANFSPVAYLAYDETIADSQR